MAEKVIRTEDLAPLVQRLAAADLDEDQRDLLMVMLALGADRLGIPSHPLVAPEPGSPRQRVVLVDDEASLENMFTPPEPGVLKEAVREPSDDEFLVGRKGITRKKLPSVGGDNPAA
jgi:hypothetical protein